MAKPIYCIDSCALIDAWQAYPITHFETVWEGLEALISSNRLIAADEVRGELEQGADECFRWAKRQSGLFCPIDQKQQQSVRLITQQFPGLSNQVARRSLADPWIIALAQARRAMVITQEKGRRNPVAPKIPDVCRKLGLQHGRFVTIFKNENWVFTRA